jgi:hypothetical protein
MQPLAPMLQEMDRQDAPPRELPLVRGGDTGDALCQENTSRDPAWTQGGSLAAQAGPVHWHLGAAGLDQLRQHVLAVLLKQLHTHHCHPELRQASRRLQLAPADLAPSLGFLLTDNITAVCLLPSLPSYPYSSPSPLHCPF